MRRAALIDDDPLVHMTWRIAAGQAGVELSTFASWEAFEAAQAGLPRETEIYIDSSLPGARGETRLGRLRALGFKTLALATGSAASDLGPEAAGTPVIGKDPPFSPAP